MSTHVFAVDFWDNNLWKKIVTGLGGLDIYDNLFCCDRYIKCKEVRIYIFSQYQWRTLLDNITPAQETALLVALQNRHLVRLRFGRMSTKVPKILCLSGSNNELEIFIMTRTAGNQKFMFDRNNFSTGNTLPWQTLKELISKGLHGKIMEEADTEGIRSHSMSPNDKSAYSLINYAKRVHGKMNWLHYLSLTEQNNTDPYNVEQIVHCLDNNSMCFISNIARHP